MESSASAITGHKHTNMKTLYIDGDMLAYRSAFSNEVETQWDDDIWTLHTDANSALAYVNDFVENTMNKLGASDYFIVFSPKTNFRYELFPAYKANRKGKRKPLALSHIIQSVSITHPSIKVNRLEADDVIGVLCTQDPLNCIAVSGDKDFATLPVTWYNFLHDTLTTRDEEEANRNHLIQTLTGDITDGYQGIKGVGPKTAVKLLDKHGWDWNGVVKTYESKGLDEEDALLTARLAYILRKQNYVNGKLKLWEPTK